MKQIAWIILLLLGACSDKHELQADVKNSTIDVSSIASGAMAGSEVTAVSGVTAASGVMASSVVNEDSEDDAVEVSKVQKTRFGDVELVRQSGMPTDRIMFNGQEVFLDQGMFVDIYKYFQTKDSDVILIGSNPGGSATPDTTLTFLIIKSKTQAITVSDPDFVADTPDVDQKTTSIDKQDHIFVNLGFREGQEMVAELNSDKLVIHAISKSGTPLNWEYCEWLFDNVKESCTSDVAHQQGCETYSKNASVYSSVSAMSQFTYISNQPGFIQSGLNKSCLAWCKGKYVSYKDFGKKSCGILNAEKQHSLSTRDCREIYETVVSDCSSQYARKNCEQFVVDAEHGAFAASNNGQNALNSVKISPWFRQAGFSEACLSRCKGKEISYEKFSNATCGTK